MVARRHMSWHRKLSQKWAGTQPRCEWPGCGTGLFITPAHSKKRRLIQTEEEYAEIAWLCQKHHLDIEVLPHEEMERIVKEIISNRAEVVAA